jgi:hypothetical protein
MHTEAVLIGHERHVLQCDAAMCGTGGRGGEGGTGTPEPDAKGSSRNQSAVKLLLWHDASCGKSMYILAQEHEDGTVVLEERHQRRDTLKACNCSLCGPQETRRPDTFHPLRDQPIPSHALLKPPLTL